MVAGIFGIFQGIIKLPVSEGIKPCKRMVIFRDFPRIVYTLFGLIAQWPCVLFKAWQDQIGGSLSKKTADLRVATWSFTLPEVGRLWNLRRSAIFWSFLPISPYHIFPFLFVTLPFSQGWLVMSLYTLGCELPSCDLDFWCPLLIGLWNVTTCKTTNFHRVPPAVL